MMPDPSETFRQEARELLETLEQSLLDLEKEPSDHDLIDSAFRALHTIKGSGAMFGFDDVAAFVHEFETAFDRVRKGKALPSHALIAVALSAKDHIHKLIESPDEAKTGGEAILVDLRWIVDAAPGDDAIGGTAPAKASQSTARETIWKVRFRLAEDALVTGTNPLLLLDELRALGPCEVTALVDAVPNLDELDPEVCYLGWEVRLTSQHPRQAIEDVFMFLCDGMNLDISDASGAATPHTDVVVQNAIPAAQIASAAPRIVTQSDRSGVAVDDGRQRGDARADAATAEAGQSRVKADRASAASLRVPAERLDELMDRVGELVIAQARLNQIASASTDANLKTIAEELERLSAGLRDTTMGIRMVPIGTLFGRFRRLVHDLSRDLGKDIDFVTSGEETELDKTVIERLADPLVHLIRNSVDHGLEPADRRLASGKSAKGVIRLSAVHSGAEVAISVIDDGAGLDAVRIRAKAEEAGLISRDAKIADADLYQFLFHPGFSTAREVTSLSGRGVGMDVVKRTIEGLRGKIELSTVAGQGTTATLRLPLTLAIIDGMLVRVGKSRYTIPLSAVEECVELPSDIDRSTGRNFLNIRGSLVPFLRLSELFKAHTPPDAYQKVVIVSSGESRVGLVVDQIIGNNQTVIKSLSKLHADIGNFSGATILGDGTVALILDVIQLVSFGQAFEDRLRSITEKAA
jgi:two-component system chemotaxis sensor kinase CheA